MRTPRTMGSLLLGPVGASMVMLLVFPFTGAGTDVAAAAPKPTLRVQKLSDTDGDGTFEPADGSVDGAGKPPPSFSVLDSCLRGSSTQGRSRTPLLPAVHAIST